MRSICVIKPCCRLTVVGNCLADCSRFARSDGCARLSVVLVPAFPLAAGRSTAINGGDRYVGPVCDEGGAIEPLSNPIPAELGSEPETARPKKELKSSGQTNLAIAEAGGDRLVFAGRLVEAAENVAANTTHGFVWMHRFAPRNPKVETIEHPEIADGMPMISPDAPPMRGFRSNEAFGTEVGLTTRQTAANSHQIQKWNIPDMLRATGCFAGPDGQKIVLIPDLIADRATGVFKKRSFVATPSIPDVELASWGVVAHGPYDPRNAAPFARDDSVSARVDQPVSIDVLTSDCDPDKDALVIVGTTDARIGDVVELADGWLLYRPNMGYAGADEFTYWAADGAGYFASPELRITVVQQ